MKAICPINAEHNEFVTTAHVMQEWVVDESGDFIKVLKDLETTHSPNPGNCWTCNICGADAIVEE